MYRDMANALSCIACLGDEMQAKVHGMVSAGFEAAREQFTANFEREGDYREAGASYAAFHKGKLVVDLWGGHADAARTVPWTRDTLVERIWHSLPCLARTPKANDISKAPLDS